MSANNLLVFFFPQIFPSGLLFSKLVFQEEFSGDSLDTNKWAYQSGCSEVYGAGNLQCYMEGSNNIKVKKGIMKITAKIEKVEDKNFTSGRIIQKGDGILYGYFVIRARLPKANHLWPALWLLKRDNCYQEADIFENKADWPFRFLFSAHYGVDYRNVVKHSWANNTRIDFSRDFHNYGLHWTPGKLAWYIDQKLYYEVPTDRATWSSPNKTACAVSPFSQPMNLIFNLAVGGTLFNKTSFTPEEAKKWKKPNLEIDWVRVYR